VDGVVQLDGFVDDVTTVGGRLTLAGRDQVGHLVDCSAEPRSYTKIKLDTLAEKIAGAWVPVWQVDPLVTLTLHAYVKVDTGESIWDVLARLARKDKAILWLDAQGVGHIGRPTYTDPVVHAIRHCTQRSAQRSNVWEPEVVVSGRDRYSSITVIGSAGNTRGTWGSAALQSRTVVDDEVFNDRRLIMPDGDVKNLKQAQTKADDEVERRFFEGTTARYTAPGFYGEPAQRGATPQLFQADQRVSLVDEYADLDGVYYCTGRQFRFSVDEGHTTRLELHPSGVWMP
jgi:prophage tail gpP-like protein